MAVPVDRTLGREGLGWSVAMDLLPFERSTALWHRAAYLHRRLQGLLEAVPAGALDPTAVGEVAQLLAALRARSRATQHRLARGEHLGPETSVDKVLVATAEQAVFDLVADGLGPEVTVGDDHRSDRWRREFLYAGGHHLRGDGGDPTEHHRPPSARPGCRPVMDDEEQALFEGSLRRACESASGATLDRALDQLGWSEALADDRRTAIATLFEQVGTANTVTSALDTVIGSALGVSVGLPTGLVLPTLGRTDPPGRMVGDELLVAGMASSSLADTTTAWVVADSEDGPQVVEVATADLTLRAVQGVDPRSGLIEVFGDGVPPAAPGRRDAGDWPQAVALAQLATAHELVGASRAMLELARAHALGRIQFGQPIADFQAVRHRLADTLVAIEATDALLGSAWDEGTPTAAASAKALAGRSAKTATRHCQQVLAGIGFTTEHDFHHYVRRVLVLDQRFGASRTLTRELGLQLLATRQLPPLPPL